MSWKSLKLHLPVVYSHVLDNNIPDFLTGCFSLSAILKNSIASPISLWINSSLSFVSSAELSSMYCGSILKPREPAFASCPRDNVSDLGMTEMLRKSVESQSACCNKINNQNTSFKYNVIFKNKLTIWPWRKNYRDWRNDSRLAQSEQWLDKRIRALLQCWFTDSVLI